MMHSERGGRCYKWLKNLFTKKLKIVPGIENAMVVEKKKQIIYIVGCPSSCLSFCKVRKEKSVRK